MFELLRNSDPVLISRLDAALKAAGIRCFVFDIHTASAYGGALAAVASRMMVADEDRGAALQVLASIEADACGD
ncbi:MAG: DUF2007 domain-containing protein [Rhodospirillales bacterium]|nr:DUF2007 domain-containing protein [Rhodospirillales bacterium]